MAIIPTSGEFTKVPEGGGSGGALFCTDTNGMLDKTMGEIIAACSSGTPIVVYTGTQYLFTVIVTDVNFNSRDHVYVATIQCLEGVGSLVYAVSGTTETAALSAYPHR